MRRARRIHGLCRRCDQYVLLHKGEVLPHHVRARRRDEYFGEGVEVGPDGKEKTFLKPPPICRGSFLEPRDAPA